MKGVLMTKMVQELNLTNLTPEIDLSDMRIMTAEINRPALQLTGYLECHPISSAPVLYFAVTGDILSQSDGLHPESW